MTRSALIVVDVQNGFVTEHSGHVVPVIKNLLDSWTAKDCGDVVFTRYINYDGSMFEKVLNWSKLKTSPEIDIVEELAPHAQLATAVVDKKNYTLFDEVGIELARRSGWEEVYVCGIDTEVCVLKTAVDAFELGITPWLLADASYSHSGAEPHEAGLLVAGKMIGRGQIIESRKLLGR